MQVPHVRLGASQMGSGDVALLKVPLLRLWQFQDLSHASQATSAVSPVPLIVPEPDAMLLLPVSDQSEDCRRRRCVKQG